MPKTALTSTFNFTPEASSSSSAGNSLGVHFLRDVSAASGSSRSRTNVTLRPRKKGVTFNSSTATSISGYTLR